MRSTATDAMPSSEAVEAAALNETSSATAPSSADLNLAQAIDRGTLSPDEAQAQLLEQVLCTQLPENATETQIAQLRADLQTMLADDPLIRDLLT